MDTDRPPPPEEPEPEPPDSLEQFASDLRQLRFKSGNPTLEALSIRTSISKSVLSEALSGRRLPTERTVTLLVQTLEGDTSAWLKRRHHLDPRSVAAEKRHDNKPDEVQAPPPEQEPTEDPPSRRHLLRAVAATAAVTALATSGIWLGVMNNRISTVKAESAAAAQSITPETGVDPTATDCKYDAVIAVSDMYLDNTVQVQLLYSSKCMAAWGRVTRYDGMAPGEHLSMTVYPAADPDGDRTQKRSAYDVQSIYTPMIIEPDVNARICGIATVSVDGKDIERGPPSCG